MTRATECLPHPSSGTPIPAIGWLGRLLGRVVRPGAGQPTRLDPDHLSSYMLKDIGLKGSAIDGRNGRSLMDWPIR